jgi:acetyl esterase/lipase
MGPFHSQFQTLSKLCRELGTSGTLLEYPKAPEHTWQEVHPWAQEALLKVGESHPNKNQVWIGDSSGGGLALSIAAQKKPATLNKLLLISPWLDLSLSQPEIEALESQDPFLSKPGTLAMARQFAAGHDLKDPLLSPYFLNPTSFPFQIQIVSGERDILHPAIVHFFETQKSANPNLELVVGKNLLHTWPLMPIPEARLIKRQWVQNFLK